MPHPTRHTVSTVAILVAITAVAACSGHTDSSQTTATTTQSTPAAASAAANVPSGTKSDIIGSWKLVGDSTGTRYYAFNFKPYTKGLGHVTSVVQDSLMPKPVTQQLTWYFQENGHVVLNNPKADFSMVTCAFRMQDTNNMLIQCDRTSVLHMVRK